MDTLGFTGNRGGMSRLQRDKVWEILRSIIPFYDLMKARHGVCQGSDEQFHDMARVLGLFMIGHPGQSDTGLQHYLSKKALASCDQVEPAKPFLVRNRHIVNLSGLMLATPSQKEEIKRGSGTWATIRYTRDTKKPLVIIYPDGSIEDRRHILQSIAEPSTGESAHG